MEAIKSYRRFVSPMLPASCRYWPTCSEYTLEAVQKHGVVRGGVMGAWRILRCNPWSKGGIDPVR
jgi:putative membrane protein insertion efficiency factor